MLDPNIPGNSPMGLGIPPINIKIMLESNPLTSIMLVGGSAVPDVVPAQTCTSFLGRKPRVAWFQERSESRAAWFRERSSFLGERAFSMGVSFPRTCPILELVRHARLSSDLFASGFRALLWESTSWVRGTASGNMREQTGSRKRFSTNTYRSNHSFVPTEISESLQRPPGNLGISYSSSILSCALSAPA